MATKAEKQKAVEQRTNSAKKRAKRPAKATVKAAASPATKPRSRTPRKRQAGAPPLPTFRAGAPLSALRAAP
jgi:hypothetical protein